MGKDKFLRLDEEWIRCCCVETLSIDINSRIKIPHRPEGKKGGETEREGT